MPENVLLGTASPYQHDARYSAFRSAVRISASGIRLASSKKKFASLTEIRQATAAGQMDSCPYERNSLFILSIGEASQRAEGRSLVFLDDGWSLCPANVWVPAAMLQ